MKKSKINSVDSLEENNIILKTKIHKCNLQYPADCKSKLYYPNFKGCDNTTKRCVYREEVILILQRNNES